MQTGYPVLIGLRVVEPWEAENLLFLRHNWEL